MNTADLASVLPGLQPVLSDLTERFETRIFNAQGLQSYLIDPLPQVRKWGRKFFHVHGKDATVRWDVVREHGVHGRHPYVQMRTPGFGATDWTRVISELRLVGYHGSIDIEGWHDPVYRNDLEMTGQVAALEYLKRCRGGSQFIPNPA